MPKYVGIDFSGDQTQWGPNATASNVWIAVIEEQNNVCTLTSLQRVQQLPGPNRPFASLGAWLSQGSFSSAAIDAPFSVPWWLFGPKFSNHPALLTLVDALPLRDSQDFPTGQEFLGCVSTSVEHKFTKPLRLTECYWRGRGVNVRSTVWTGARAGAPFTSACIKLLANAGRTLWPWADSDSIPLIEAFPAAQLQHWGLPFAQYNGVTGRAHRATIVAHLIAARGLQVSGTLQGTIRADADALDAVLSCYAARAVMTNQLGVAVPPFEAWRFEGWIAVHE